MSSAESLFDHGSFRDPSARVLRHDGQVVRYVNADALRDWETLAATRFFSQYTHDGRIVATERVTAPPIPVATPWVAALHHATIPVISYPYEWCFSMLKDAALLQLDLQLAALDEGMTMKDATPFNVQWIGTRSTFIDTTSFTRAVEGEPWAGYRQFCEMFLNPLLLQAYKNVAFHAWLRGSLDGIESGQLSQLMSLRDRLRPGVFAHVYLLAKLQSRYAATSRDVRHDLRAAGFGAALVRANVKRMRRLVERLTWVQARSTWSDYAESSSYDREDRARKARFVQTAASERRRALVWDLGCNTGEYSRAVRGHADYIVAVDADHLAVERLYRVLKDEGNNTILPLVGDLTNPTPAIGWRNRERQTLENRGSPDLILALALVHHLAISHNVPIPDLVDWFASFGSEVVVEFVAPGDAMVQQLLRNREPMDFGYTQARFEACLSTRFQIVARETLHAGTRTIYHVRPRRAG